MVDNFMKTCNETYIYPTDTVWGIGGSIYSIKSYQTVCAVKKIKYKKPLSILFGELSQITDFFHLPREISRDFLADFFSHESTMALPLSTTKSKIPEWITANSPYIAFRCLEFPWIQKITNHMEGPITTTSLNISGEKEQFSRNDALKFYQQSKLPLNFVDPENPALSGRPSTIVLYEKHSMTFLRRGIFAKQIEQLFGLLSA